MKRRLLRQVCRDSSISTFSARPVCWDTAAGQKYKVPTLWGKQTTHTQRLPRQVKLASNLCIPPCKRFQVLTPVSFVSALQDKCCYSGLHFTDGEMDAQRGQLPKPGSLLLTTKLCCLSLVLSARKNIDQGIRYNRERWLIKQDSSEQKTFEPKLSEAGKPV